MRKIIFKAKFFYLNQTNKCLNRIKNICIAISFVFSKRKESNINTLKEVQHKTYAWMNLTFEPISETLRYVTME